MKFSYIKDSIIKNLLTEESIPVKKMTSDSLDSQVDKYLTEYESEALKTKNEGLDFRSMTRSFLTEKATEHVDKKQKGELSIESFVNDVVRLIENYDSLLEVRNTILKRARNFLAESYETDIIDQFDTILEDEHGLSIGKSKFDLDTEDEQPVSYSGSGGGA